MDITRFDEIESTNAKAKEMVRARSGVPFCLVAKRQSGGVGRYGRKFWSPEGGLYMTLVADDLDYKFTTGFVAVCLINVIKKQLEKNRKIEIKWVNDILVDGKKVAGILVEKVGKDFVIGIGVNMVQTEKVPKDIEDRVGFLGFNINVNEIINEIMVTKISDEEVKVQYKKYCNQSIDINLDGSLNMPNGQVVIASEN